MERTVLCSTIVNAPLRDGAKSFDPFISIFLSFLSWHHQRAKLMHFTVHWRTLGRRPRKYSNFYALEVTIKFIAQPVLGMGGNATSNTRPERAPSIHPCFVTLFPFRPPRSGGGGRG